MENEFDSPTLNTNNGFEQSEDGNDSEETEKAEKPFKNPDIISIIQSRNQGAIGSEDDSDVEGSSGDDDGDYDEEIESASSYQGSQDFQL